MALDVSFKNRHQSYVLILTFRLSKLGTIPNGVIYKEFNSTIKIVCTVDLDDPKSDGLNSSYLSFKLTNNEPHPPNVEMQVN